MSDVPTSADSAAKLDLGVPTAARVYDVMLNGKDNYAVDRQVAEASLAVMPELKDIAIHNREMLHRVVRYLAAEEGITQFIDLGSGLPTARNTHEVVHEANPDAKVAYVDIDPLVLVHGHAILADNPNTQVVTADIRQPQKVLGHPDIRALIDFDQPVCVMLVGILHHLMDEEDPKGIIDTLRDAVPSGSFFFITNFTRLGDAPESVELERPVGHRPRPYPRGAGAVLRRPGHPHAGPGAAAAVASGPHRPGQHIGRGPLYDRRGRPQALTLPYSPISGGWASQAW